MSTVGSFIRHWQGSEAVTQSNVQTFSAEFHTSIGGVVVNISLLRTAGITSLDILRNISTDITSAMTVESVTPTQDRQTFGVTDYVGDIAGQVTLNYWARLNTANQVPVVIGPVSVPVNGDSIAPAPIADFDVNHQLGDGVAVTVCCSFLPADTKFDSVRISATGYLGNPNPAIVASAGSSPFRFQMLQTGETVTLSALALSSTGVAAVSSPTKNLTLTMAATVPAKIMGPSQLVLTTGVQINFRAGAEPDVTLFRIYRADLNAGFGAATLIGTVTPTGSGTYDFLDTTGLGGQYEWYVVAVNSVGESAPSRATTNQILSSAQLPPNSPLNNTNFATVDSIDNGLNATVRVYGTGGVGSSWTRQTGYGVETYPTLTSSGHAYATTYYVNYDKANAVYVFDTTFPDTLPDNYVWTGKVTTVAMGGGGGTMGGGGSSGGGSGGGRNDPL